MHPNTRSLHPVRAPKKNSCIREDLPGCMRNKFLHPGLPHPGPNLLRHVAYRPGGSQGCNGPHGTDPPPEMLNVCDDGRIYFSRIPLRADEPPARLGKVVILPPMLSKHPGCAQFRQESSRTEWRTAPIRSAQSDGSPISAKLGPMRPNRSGPNRGPLATSGH